MGKKEKQKNIDRGIKVLNGFVAKIIVAIIALFTVGGVGYTIIKNNVIIFGDNNYVNNSSTDSIHQADASPEGKDVPTDDVVNLVSLAVSEPPSKTTYYIGEAFQAKGLVLEATYSNGNVKQVSIDNMSFSPEIFSSAGKQNVTISYGGVSATCEVTVYGATRILEDHDLTGKTENKAKEELEKYSVYITVEYEAADGAHTGRVLSCRATSDQSITLVVGEKTDFSIRLNKKGDGVIITGTSKSTGSLDIPERVNGLVVTEIDDYAFEESAGCDIGLRKVSLPSGLVRIGEGAFSNCLYLEEVVLPDSVEEIGDFAFWGCTALTSVSFGEVKTIGKFAFRFCMSIKQIDIPNTCTSIGEQAFESVWAAKKITLPASLAYIGPGAFTGCSKAEFHAAPDSYAEQYLSES